VSEHATVPVIDEEETLHAVFLSLLAGL
jgi:hypothetical protein